MNQSNGFLSNLVTHQPPYQKAGTLILHQTSYNKLFQDSFPIEFIGP